MIQVKEHKYYARFLKLLINKLNDNELIDSQMTIEDLITYILTKFR